MRIRGADVLTRAHDDVFFSSPEQQLAKGYADLAALYARKADYERAETLYQQALDMRAQTLGPTHPDYAQVIHTTHTHTPPSHIVTLTRHYARRIFWSWRNCTPSRVSTSARFRSTRR